VIGLISVYRQELNKLSEELEELAQRSRAGESVALEIEQVVEEYNLVVDGHVRQTEEVMGMQGTTT